MNPRSPFILLLSVVAAILAASYVGMLWLFLIPLSLSVALFLYGRKMVFLFPIFLLFSLGWLSMSLALPQCEGADIHDGEAEVIGVVEKSVTTTYGERSQLDVDRILYADGSSTECRNIDVTVIGGATTLYPGDIVKVRGKLSLRQAGKGYQASWVCRYRNHTLSLLGRNETIFSQSYSVRSYLGSRIDDMPLSSAAKGILKALMLGDRQSISYAGRSLFADAGVSHILAVSGMHVGIICVVVMFLTSPILLLQSGFRWRPVVCAVIVWLFVITTGMSNSALRAAVMITFGMTAFASGRRGDSFGMVCLAAMVILLVSPESLWDIGLQLSYVCVAALCLFVERLNFVDRVSHPRTRNVVGLLLTTLVATAATWPLSAYYFGMVPVHFLIANIVCVPLLPLYLIISGVYILLWSIGLDFTLLRHCVDAYPQLLTGFLSFIHGDALTLDIPASAVLLWLSAVGVCAYALNSRRVRVDVNTAGEIAGYKVNVPALSLALLLATASIAVICI